MHTGLQCAVSLDSSMHVVILLCTSPSRDTGHEGLAQGGTRLPLSLDKNQSSLWPAVKHSPFWPWHQAGGWRTQLQSRPLSSVCSTKNTREQEDARVSAGEDLDRPHFIPWLWDVL